MTELVHQMKMLATTRDLLDRGLMNPGFAPIPSPPLLIGVAPDDHLVVRPDHELTERRNQLPSRSGRGA